MQNHPHKEIIQSKIRKEMQKKNKKFPTHLLEVPEDAWPDDPPENLIRVCRSRRFLVQIYDEGDCLRFSVNKTEVDREGKWKENITWEDLQQLKRQAGYGEMYAVEVFPSDHDIVNVANLRHLWILNEPLGIGWVQGE